MPRLIGLTGPNAAGKGEVARYLAQRGFAVHSLSDIVREEALARGRTTGRGDLIATGTQLRREGGPGVLAERILPRLGPRDVVDSIRNPAEVAVLRQVPGFLLLAVDAPAELRFERSRRRARAGDPEDLEEFRRREQEENSSDPAAQQLRATCRLADRTVYNAGDLAALRRVVDEVLAAEAI